MLSNYLFVCLLVACSSYNFHSIILCYYLQSVVVGLQSWIIVISSQDSRAIPMAFDMNNLVLAVEDDSSSYVRQPGWLCDFNFGYGCGKHVCVGFYDYDSVIWLLKRTPCMFVDVVEEDALNEKYCIQVLRILITKEDSEIDQLEKDLVSLQSELAWFEYEEWSDICCNALRKNIDSLRTSLTSLKSNDIEVHLSIKPAESLHEIMKALLSDLFPEEIKQVHRVLENVLLVFCQ